MQEENVGWIDKYTRFGEPLLEFWRGARKNDQWTALAGSPWGIAGCSLLSSSSLTLLCSSLPWRPMGSRTQASELPILSCAFRVTTVLDVWTSIFLRSWMWERVLSPPKERKQTRKVWCILLRTKTPPLPNSRIELIWFAHQHEEMETSLCGGVNVQRGKQPGEGGCRWDSAKHKRERDRRQHPLSKFNSSWHLSAPPGVPPSPSNKQRGSRNMKEGSRGTGSWAQQW